MAKEIGFFALLGFNCFIRHQDLMHPSSESFSFGTLKDIMLFFLLKEIFIYNNTNATPPPKKNKIVK